MFQELMPLLAHRTLIVTMSRASDDEIRIMIRAVAVSEKFVNEATPPIVEPEPRTVARHLLTERRVR
jgi:hypothetical protein